MRQVSLQNKTRSITLAAESGDAMAQFLMGWMHHVGDGTPIDYSAAITWYTKAAQQGHVAAMSNLGLIYRERQFNDESEYYRWSAKAAQLCDRQCQIRIAKYILRNTTGQSDHVTAYAWFLAARHNGDRALRNAMARMLLYISLTPKERSAARSFVVKTSEGWLVDGT